MLTRLLHRLGYERRSHNQAAGGDSYWQDFAALRDGGVVTAQTAQGMAAVYACVHTEAETVSTLPLHVFRPYGARRRPGAPRAGEKSPGTENARTGRSTLFAR